MRLQVERSGGFRGIGPTSSISTDQLPAEEAKKLNELVEAAGFYDLPAEIRSTGTGADGFQYKVTVESERGSHTVQVDEDAVPPSLQLVLDWMRNYARTRAGK